MIYINDKKEIKHIKNLSMVNIFIGAINSG